MYAMGSLIRSWCLLAVALGGLFPVQVAAEDREVVLFYTGHTGGALDACKG